MRHAFGVILVFVVGSVQAATVDFEEIDVFGIGSDGQEVYNPGTPLESGGLLFTSSPTSRNIHVNGKDFVDARSYLSFANNGSNYLSSYTNSGDYALSISSANSNYFSLTSIDLAEY